MLQQQSGNVSVRHQITAKRKFAAFFAVNCQEFTWDRIGREIHLNFGVFAEFFCLINASARS